MFKRVILILSLILILNLCPTPAEEQVVETCKINGQVEYDDNLIEVIYLDDSVDKPEVNIPQLKLTLPVRVLNITSNTNTARSALARSMAVRNSISDILPLVGSITETTTGGFSYGTRYGEEISYSQVEATTAFFLRYDAPKHFSFESAFSKSANRDLEDSQWTTFRLTPEWHITDKLTLKNNFTNYVQSQKNKNELKLVYTPSLKKYAESLKFELGIAQSYYANGNKSESIGFSTGFKL